MADDVRYLDGSLPTGGDKFQRIAAQFGVDSIHVVAHSKGGLDCREYLAGMGARGSKALTFLSLTTLSTPHDGSVLADIQRAVHSKDWPLIAGTQGYLSSDQGVPIVNWQNFSHAYTQIALIKSTNPGHKNLTLPWCATFNASNVPMLPPGIQYVAVGADMDMNDSKDIDKFSETRQLWDDEHQAFDGGLPGISTVYEQVAKTRKVVVYRTRQGNFTAISLFGVNDGFVGNDIFVTIPSSHGDTGGYGHVVSWFGTYSGANGRNHSDIGDSGIGHDVRERVISIERNSGDLTQ